MSSLPRLSSAFRLHSPKINTRQLSTSFPRLANRAIVYKENGGPASVLSVVTNPSLPDPAPQTVNVRFLLSPINPADINVVEGVYPAKPTRTPEGVFVGGNEGVAEVTSVGDGVSGVKVGEWVVLGKQQSGTWRSAANVGAGDVIRVDKSVGEVAAATITVNPATAYNMLSDFADLKPGDWVLQNGANSAVGQAVIQIAKSRGLNTLNFVRNREGVDSLKGQLTSLGATHVATYDDLADKAFRDTVKSWTGGKDIRLALNCVSGPTTTNMARYLGHDAFLVSYGAMSKQPLSLPTSLFIFKNLQSVGFWQSRWYKEKTKEERETLMRTLVELFNSGKLKEPEHEILTLRADESDEAATTRLRGVLSKMAEGQYGKKVLLQLEGE
ncbi:hypothetical protein HWV62_21462 [Athelia sp. TMB]|nr:hypothetical protein HWV62_21462 [Athelia sp. TMB]